MATQLSQTVLRDLPDGIHVLVCGAGGPQSDAKRSGPCVAVQAGGHLFVVDAGTNGARNLVRMGVDIGRVEALLITHGHSEQFDGMGELGVLRWTSGGHDSPLPVYGPRAINEIVAGINIAYGPDSRYRVEQHGMAILPPTGAGLQSEAFPMPNVGAVARVLDTPNGVSIKAFSVDHPPVQRAVGYRIEYRGLAVVITGNTKKSESVQFHAQGADILIHEAIGRDVLDSMINAAVQAGDTRHAQILDDTIRSHTSSIQAAEVAAAADVKHLVFYQITPPLSTDRLEQVFLSGVDEVFEGEVTLSEDGTLISLPLSPESQ